MNFFVKLTIGFVTIASAVCGGIWGAFEINDARMDYKDDKVKKEVLTIVYGLKDERNALMKAQDEKFAIQMVAVNENMREIKKDVRSILGIARKSQVFVDNANKSYYTVRETENTKGNHL